MDTVEPTTTEVNEMTSEMLNLVQAIFDKYVVFPNDEARDATVLWAAHTHVATAFESTPRLAVLSAEPGSGKSRVLELLQELVPSPMCAVYLHPSVIWRTIDQASPCPTILIDEADTLFGRVGSGSARAELRSILNAGHRKGATVPRCVGTQDVRRFKVFAPVALAGLGTLPETIMARAITINMKRRHKGQEVTPLRMRFAAGAFMKAKEMLGEWAIHCQSRLQIAFPEMPVQDRPADVWEPLFAIADLAGGDWHARVAKACIKLTAEEHKQTGSMGVALLNDLREVFELRYKMFTEDIIEALHRADTDTDWSDLSPRTLARVLAEYGVSPTTLREGDRVAKGYRSRDLQIPWDEYLSNG